MFTSDSAVESLEQLLVHFISPFTCSRVLQHRIKVALTVILLLVFALSYYLDGPHQTVSKDLGQKWALFRKKLWVWAD